MILSLTFICSLKVGEVSVSTFIDIAIVSGGTLQILLREIYFLRVAKLLNVVNSHGSFSAI